MTNGEKFEKEIKEWIHNYGTCDNCPAKSCCHRDNINCAQTFYKWSQEEYAHAEIKNVLCKNLLICLIRL